MAASKKNGKRKTTAPAPIPPIPSADDSPAKRLGKHTAQWADAMFEHTAGSLETQSRLLRKYKGADIVRDVQSVSQTVVGIWLHGINQLLEKK
jgi:hypothetical protein